MFFVFFNIRLIIHLFTSSLNYGRWINLWKKLNRPNFEGSSINLLNTLGWLIDYLTTYITLTTRIPWLSVIFVCSLSALFEKLSALLAGDFTSLAFLYALRYCEYRNKRKCLFSTILRSKQQNKRTVFLIISINNTARNVCNNLKKLSAFPFTLFKKLHGNETNMNTNMMQKRVAVWGRT